MLANSRSRRSAGGSPVWFQLHEERHQVLVDLGLQLQLYGRDRPLLPRAVHEIHEVAHALDGEQEVLQILRVEAAPRIAHRQVLQRALVDEQPELQTLVVAPDEQLLARSALHLQRVALFATDEKVAYVEIRLDAIHRLETALQRPQDGRHYWRSPLGGMTPWARSRRSIHSEPVRSQRS